MIKLVQLVQLLIVSTIVCDATNGKYTPDWNSLDSRPLPEWFDEAKIGIFIHWGVFSVPAYKSEWFWNNLEQSENNEFRDFLRTNYSTNFKYQDFATQFKAELWRPAEWASLFRKAGAKYVVLTSKHHEGFTLWPSKYSWNWNAQDVGPKRDIVGELQAAVQDENLFFGLYHSLYEWFNPNFLYDQANNFTTQTFVKTKTIPELYELVNKYKPYIIWSDGEWSANDDYWQTKEFLAWLYNESPVSYYVVVNDRWGSGTSCKHGGFFSCADRYSPGVLQKRKWENAMTIDKTTWGFSRLSNLANYYTSTELIHEMIKTVSCGGNILINVGPRSDGTIDAIFQDRLLKLGEWLSINGEGIYLTKPFKIQNDTITEDVWYTVSTEINRKDWIYASFSAWPRDDIIRLSVHEHVDDFANDYRVLLLNTEGGRYLKFQIENNETVITLNKADLLMTIKPWMLRFERISHWKTNSTD